MGVNTHHRPMSKPVVRFEIGCRDLGKTSDFYRELFDWDIRDHGISSRVLAGEGGIPGQIVSLGHEPHNYVTIYIEVDDIKAYIEKLTSLGGTLIVGPVPIPVGYFAWFKDPEGNVIALVEPSGGG